MSDSFNPLENFGFFGFGEPISAIRKNNFLAYQGLMQSFNYYEPPIRKLDLVNSLDANAHHACAIDYETQTMTLNFLQSQLLRLKDFRMAAFDFFVTGELFLKKIRNILGQVINLTHLPSLYMRVKIDGGFCRLDWYDRIIDEFEENDIVHIKNYDMRQNIYGTPKWYPQLQAILLGENALLLPRREFTDGTTRKLIMMAGFEKSLVKAFNDRLKESKGEQEKTLVAHLPENDKRLDDVIKIVSDDNAFKIPFSDFYELSATIIMECHRIPPFLVGQQVEKGASPPDLAKVEAIYAKEILQNMRFFEEINDYVPGAVTFDKSAMVG